MKRNHLLLLGALSCLVFSGCTTIGEPKAINPATGRIDTPMSYGAKATVVVSEQVDLSQYKKLLLTLGGDFFRDQSRLIGYFDQVVDREGMEKLLIAEGMSETVSDVTNYLSWKKIADQYGLFLVLKPDTRDEGRSTYFMIKAIDPQTAKDLFVAEIKLDTMWKGINDDTVFYPLFNAFLGWMEENGATVAGAAAAPTAE